MLYSVVKLQCGNWNALQCGKVTVWQLQCFAEHIRGQAPANGMSLVIQCPNFCALQCGNCSVVNVMLLWQLECFVQHISLQAPASGMSLVIRCAHLKTLSDNALCTLHFALCTLHLSVHWIVSRSLRRSLVKTYLEQTEPSISCIGNMCHHSMQLNANGFNEVHSSVVQLDLRCCSSQKCKEAPTICQLDCRQVIWTAVQHDELRWCTKISWCRSKHPWDALNLADVNQSTFEMYQNWLMSIKASFSKVTSLQCTSKKRCPAQCSKSFFPDHLANASI